MYCSIDEQACEPIEALKGNISINDPAKYFHELRLVKSAAEQAVMKEASRIGSEAFRETMKWSRHTRKESDLAARMEYECRLRGAAGLAYVPVVAGDDRGNIIHYVRNDRLITGNSPLVLVDAGAKVHHYCNDITRTWPLTGRFTAAQKEIYEAVLRIQLQCIKAAQQWKSYPEMSLETLNELANLLFVDELGRLGFNKPERLVHRVFPHSIGHYLGLDLHDCPSVSYGEPLRAGMVITIEPGLYIPADPLYPDRYHGIAVRIEDDILITEDGCQVMTDLVPKHTEEIEDLLNSK